MSHLLARKRRRMPPGRCWEKCIPSAYAACDERHTRNDFNLLRVTASSHGAASAGVETILFPRQATRMGVRRPAPGCERGLMRRTSDAIASLDRPAQGYDYAAGRGRITDLNRREPRPTLGREKGGFAPDPASNRHGFRPERGGVPYRSGLIPTALRLGSGAMSRSVSRNLPAPPLNFANTGADLMPTPLPFVVAFGRFGDVRPHVSHGIGTGTASPSTGASRDADLDADRVASRRPGCSPSGPLPYPSAGLI